MCSFSPHAPATCSASDGNLSFSSSSPRPLPFIHHSDGDKDHYQRVCVSAHFPLDGATVPLKLTAGWSIKYHRRNHCPKTPAPIFLRATRLVCDRCTSGSNCLLSFDFYYHPQAIGASVNGRRHPYLRRRKVIHAIYGCITVSGDDLHLILASSYMQRAHINVGLLLIMPYRKLKTHCMIYLSHPFMCT